MVVELACLGNDPRIKLFQGARRSIARIGESLFPGGFAFLVEFVESGLGQINLAADLEDRWQAVDGVLRNIEASYLSIGARVETGGDAANGLGLRRESGEPG